MAPLSATERALQREQADLVLAGRHIAEGEARIARQVLLIAQMDRQGLDTRLARDLLETLEAVLIQWRAHRRLILEAIARYASDRSGGAR
ncbi:hypothetical protein [Methylobacterium symbioticum]|uniref:Uncharacterized protein n=1 Tax=Methylobacterium symbioticum TaxID=2584084 RepID=A0A509EFC8_9HYPH|nr:hypothetical protein [Methylobacterium symbioticum]VUD73057.1 hypothetical protein MET9862_03669 [Methylobacterium symbioticum]